VPTDYEQKTVEFNRANAQRLSALLGFPVTVDSNGLARVNAVHVLAVLESLTINR
jgi:hypothetical protein